MYTDKEAVPTPVLTLPARHRTVRRASILVTAVCWVMAVIEGYDLISFSAVMPVLTGHVHGFTSGNIGWLASAVFCGALFGALGSGWLCDHYGRRPVALGAVAVFTLFTGLCGFAAGPLSLAALRFLAGLGIGAIVPAASVLTLEFAAARHRTLAYMIMLSGVPLGGVLAALVALPVLPHLGWRWMFFLAVIPGAVVVSIAYRWLPESAAFLQSVGRADEADAVRARFRLERADEPSHAENDPEPVASTGLFSAGYRAATILFAASSFCGLFAWFGLATWLPGIMRTSGYDLGSTLVFLLVLNLGAVAGSLLVAAATDRWGNKKIVILTYAALALVLMALLDKLPQSPLLVAVALAGIGGQSGQVLINAFVGNSYPAALRARALGWSLGVGRLGTIVGPILIGWVVSGHNSLIGFLVFALVAAIAAVLLAFIPRTPAFEGTSSS